MNTRSVRLLATVASIALSGAMFLPVNAVEKGASAGTPDGWVSIDNDDRSPSDLHVLDDGTVVGVAFGDADWAPRVFIRTPGARSWKAGGPRPEECNAVDSRATGAAVLLVVDCWSQGDPWTYLYRWTRAAGWSKPKRFVDSRPAWTGRGGVLGYGRHLLTKGGTWRTLPKLPIEAEQLYAAGPRRVVATASSKHGLLVTTWNRGAGWSSPRRITRNDARPVSTTITPRGDVGIVTAKALHTRKHGSKRWKVTRLRGRDKRRVVAPTVVATGRGMFTVVWYEQGGSNRFIRSREVSGSGRPRAIAEVSKVEEGAGVYLESGRRWLDVDGNVSGAVVIGHTRYDRYGAKAVAQVRKAGEWSDPMMIDQDEARLARVDLNANGCVVAEAAYSDGAHVLASPKCGVRHPTPADERTQLPAPDPPTDGFAGHALKLRTAITADGTRLVAYTAAAYSGYSRAYVTEYAEGAYSTPVRLRSPEGPDGHCRVKDIDAAGTGALVLYRCERKWGSGERTSYRRWSPTDGWSAPRETTIARLRGDYRGDLVLEKKAKGVVGVGALYRMNLESGTRTRIPKPSLRENIVVGGRILVALNVDRNRYQLYDGKQNTWKRTRPAPVADSLSFADWQLLGRTVLVSSDYGRQRYVVGRNGRQWSPVRRIKPSVRLRLLSDQSVVAVDETKCSGGHRVRVRRIDSDTGKLMPGAVRTPCGDLELSGVTTGADADLYVTADVPYSRADSVFYLPTADGAFSQEYAATGLARSSAQPMGDGAFLVNGHAPHYAMPSLATWDFTQQQ